MTIPKLNFFNMQQFSIDIHIFDTFNIIIQPKKSLMTALDHTVPKHINSSACSSQDYNRSSVKRLFSSVFSIIDNDQEVSHFEEQQKCSRVQKLLQNQCFVAHLLSKIRAEGLCEGFYFPVIHFAVHNISDYPQGGAIPMKAELDYNDISSIFERFGEVNKIILTKERKDAYIFFNSFINGYISLKMLRSAQLRGGALQLAINWVHSNEYHHEIAVDLQMFINSLSWESLFENKFNKIQQSAYGSEDHNYNGKQNKLTCRYDIQIENQQKFQVARRIIGSKGCNMKRIIEESINSENRNCNDNSNQTLKLRLRGRGSGYKEGPQQQQSNEHLHLCVSAKEETAYNNACTKVQKLLAAIYNEYVQFTKKQGKVIHLTVKKIIIGQIVEENNPKPKQTVENLQSQNIEINDNISPEGGLYRMSSQKISELLELRNKARRQLNFGQADRIRNYLRNCGVCLIDQKGRRGRAMQVTSWKYLY